MNAYYSAGYRAGTIGTRKANDRVAGDRLIAVICAIVAMVTCPVAVKLEKATAASALIFAFFGIVGSMEAGTLSMGLGAVLCIAIALFELVVFKSLVKKSSKKN